KLGREPKPVDMSPWKRKLNKAVLNFIIQGAIMSSALTSLESRSDYLLPPSVVTVATMFSLAIICAQAIDAGYVSADKWAAKRYVYMADEAVAKNEALNLKANKQLGDEDS